MRFFTPVVRTMFHAYIHVLAPPTNGNTFRRYYGAGECVAVGKLKGTNWVCSTKRCDIFLLITCEYKKNSGVWYDEHFVSSSPQTGIGIGNGAKACITWLYVTLILKIEIASLWQSWVINYLLACGRLLFTFAKHNLRAGGIGSLQFQFKYFSMWWTLLCDCECVMHKTFNLLPLCCMYECRKVLCLWSPRVQFYVNSKRKEEFLRRLWGNN